MRPHQPPCPSADRLAILLDGNMATGVYGTTCWFAPIPGSRTSCWPRLAAAMSRSAMMGSWYLAAVNGSALVPWPG